MAILSTIITVRLCRQAREISLEWYKYYHFLSVYTGFVPFCTFFRQIQVYIIFEKHQRTLSPVADTSRWTKERREARGVSWNDASLSCSE